MRVINFCIIVIRNFFVLLYKILVLLGNRLFMILDMMIYGSYFYLLIDIIIFFENI